MTTEEVSSLKETYKNACLYHKKEPMRASYDALKTALGVEEADKFAQETTKWVVQVDELVDQGRLLASIGKTRTSLEFETLKQRAQVLGGYVCTKFVNDFDLAVKQYKLSRIPDLGEKSVSALHATTLVSKERATLKPSPLLPMPSWALKGENEMAFSLVHRNFIGGLKPAPSWEILLDESGAHFTDSISWNKNEVDDDIGCLVAVLVPSYSNLPPLSEGFHAADVKQFGDGVSPQAYDQRNKVVKDNLKSLLEASCGIMGISVKNFLCLEEDSWFSGIGRLLALIFRLLPIDGPTNLSIKVEQRGAFFHQYDDYLKVICKVALQEMQLVFPERVKKIKLKKCQFIKKDESVFNGYVDCVAFAWRGYEVKPDLWREVMEKTNWLDTCLLHADSTLICKSLDLLQMKDVPSAEDWNALHRGSAGNSNNTFLDNTILYLLGERVQQNPELWRRYQEYTLSHLNSKAIDMRLLSRQVDWLKAWQPVESELSPRTRLLWLTIKLAAENHRGEVLSFSQLRGEFQSLCERLYMEDAPLVCFAMLHLAVSFTDAFEFEKAKALLLPWAKKDPAIPGRRYYASVLSSLGQHEAFLGNQDQAVEYFQKAIQEFEKLSDADEASGEIGQTSAYLVTAMMDQAEVDYPALDQAMEKYLLHSLVEAARKLPSTKAPGNKYPHHILLRYLMLPKAQAAVREEYLAGKKDWQVPAAQGHPWELIEFYRGLLCEDVLEKRTHLRAACEIAKAGGATLRLIAAAILGGILTFDDTVKEEYLVLVEKVIREIPNLGAEQCECLRNQPIALLSPLALMQKVLPFNFR